MSLSEVDLNTPELASCMRSHDVPEDGCDEYGDPIPAENYRLWKVEACYSHGAKAPLFQESGHNVRKLIAAAKREARQLASNDDVGRKG